MNLVDSRTITDLRYVCELLFADPHYAFVTISQAMANVSICEEAKICLRRYRAKLELNRSIPSFSSLLCIGKIFADDNENLNRITGRIMMWAARKRARLMLAEPLTPKAERENLASLRSVYNFY